VADPTFFEWLLTGGLGPALVGLPVGWAGRELAQSAKAWFDRYRGCDSDTRRALEVSVGVQLTDEELACLRGQLEGATLWELAGRRCFEDLVIQIACCLPPHRGRDKDGSLTAARVLATAVCEYHVANLDDAAFRTLLIARLDRMDESRETALDAALLSLHADIAGRAALDASHYRSLRGHLERILRRLPPGPATRSGVVAYLRSLVEVLDRDPWPRQAFSTARAPTPSRLERHLRTLSQSSGKEVERSADELAARCVRLVVLGGTGSGKTWLSKRIARNAAKRALKELDLGRSLDDVELPLWTTCAKLFGCKGAIRNAVVDAALESVGDLGSARLVDSLRALFGERSHGVVMVLDSLDEAGKAVGPRQRLEQAAGIHGWRFVLTSRPGAWANQVEIDDSDDRQCLVRLLPLKYPREVEEMIESWLGSAGDALRAHLRVNPELQRSASVPLICAMYCLVGGEGAVPATRRELYAAVLGHLLTAAWRDDDTQRAEDPQACRYALTQWAWAGARADGHSGLGAWPEEIVAYPRFPELTDQDRLALDHVAPQSAPPDSTTGLPPRRFIHRSLRDHLVAEHLATLPISDAADQLRSHLWYDPDYEDVAPAAVAAHPNREALLAQLLEVPYGQVPTIERLDQLDACFELRRLLCRIAAESDPAAWPTLGAVFERTRADLLEFIGTNGPLDIAGAQLRHWTASNQALIERLATTNSMAMAVALRDAIAQLGLDEAERARALGPLFDRLATTHDDDIAAAVADAVVRIEPGDEARKRVVGSLVERLRVTDDAWIAARLADKVAALGPGDEAREQAVDSLLERLTSTANPRYAVKLAFVIARLKPGDETRDRAVVSLAEHLVNGEAKTLRALRLVDAIAGLKAGEAALDGVVRSLVQRLDTVDPRSAATLADAIARLQPGEEARERAVGTLVQRLDTVDPRSAAALASAIRRLEPGEEARDRAADSLVQRLDTVDPRSAATLAEVVPRLEPGEEARDRAADSLVQRLDVTRNDKIVARLADAIVGVRPGEEARERALGSLLERLAATGDARIASRLTGVIVRLEPGDEARDRALGSLLERLAATGNARIASRLTDAIVALEPCDETRHRAVGSLVGRVAATDNPKTATGLVDVIARLEPGDEARDRALGSLLERLAATGNARIASRLTDAILRLKPTEEARERAVGTLVERLAATDNAKLAPRLADAILRLKPTEEARDETLGLLVRCLAKGNAGIAASVAEAIVRLKPGDESRERVVASLVERLANIEDAGIAARLAHAIVRLKPGEEARDRAVALLLESLAAASNAKVAAGVADAIVRLEPGDEARERAVGSLVERLPARKASVTQLLAGHIARLGPTTDIVHTQRDALSQVELRHVRAILASARQKASWAEWRAFLLQ
jgi:hypothetical protein